jgi:hypothetical protein
VSVNGGGGMSAAGGPGEEAVGPVAQDDDAPSELLSPLLEEWPDLLRLVLAHLDPTDCTMLARTGKPWLAVVVANNLPRAGKTAGVRLKLSEFVGSVERLAWAKDNGCPWVEETCATVARGGHLQVLQWARAHDCPWRATTCDNAAHGGHLEVLKWARAHSCEWSEMTCARAAGGGHLEMLQWARQHGCP